MRLRALNLLAPNMLPVYSWMAQRLGARLDISIDMAAGTHYRQAEDADLVFMCGLAYINRDSAWEAVAAPVLVDARCAGQPRYFSDLIVHAGSPCLTFADLRGCTWGYNEPESQSGYGIVRAALAQQGTDLSYFGAVRQVGYHAKAIAGVAAGTIDAAAIDIAVLAMALRDDPALQARLRVVATLGPSPIQPLAARAGLARTLKDDIRHAVVDLHAESGAAHYLGFGLIERWVGMSDADYDPIRAMTATWRAAP